MKMKLLQVLIHVFVVKCFALSIQSNNATVNMSLEERVASLERKINILESRSQDVMFYAIIENRAFELQKESTVVFEKVIINVGDHYDQYDGVFVSPTKGVYLFSWTVSLESTGYVITELVVEDKVISATGGTDTNGGYHSASMTALCSMEKGDHAFIRTTGFGTANTFRSEDNHPQTSFLGLLIQSQ